MASTVPLTQIYADFAARARAADLPSRARDTAVLGFTDVVGVMLAGRLESAVQVLRETVREEGSRPVSRSPWPEERLSPPQAALVNACAAHALDYDDFAFSNHPSAVLVPAILAVADARPVSGERMALAYAVGYEIWCDLFQREHDLYYDRGWHPTAVLGPVGAAAAASVVLGLDAIHTRHALSLAASDSAGVFENFGTMAKPWHGGRTAAAGVRCALLAARGLEASASALEGSRGLMRALSPGGHIDLETTPAFSGEWRIERIGLNLKQYPVVGAAQRIIDAVLAFDAGTRPAPEDIESIIVSISVRHAAVMPYHNPRTALEAKFSVEFAVACALVHGAVGLPQLSDSVVRDSRLQRLMACTQIETTEAFEPGWRDAAPFDEVRLKCRDGRMVESPPVRRPKGHSDLPLTQDELHAKFRTCTDHANVAAGASESLFASLQRLPDLALPSDIPLPA